MIEKETRGRPKRFKDPVLNTFYLERALLKDIDKIRRLKKLTGSRSEFIRDAVSEYTRNQLG